MLTVITDGVRWAAFERFFGQRDFLRSGGLLMNDRKTEFGIAGKKSRRGRPAHVTVDASVVDVVATGYILW